MANKEVLLEIKHMNKVFGSTIALKDVSLTVNRGEIRGLVGENGSGKSTITSIIAGMQKPTKGEMYFKGHLWEPSSMVDAQKHGISMILQEANTISNCTVAENLFAGREKQFSKFGFFSNKKMNDEADKLLNKFGISHIKGKDNINKYSFEERKLIEIIRGIDENTEVLIVDETTTALSFEGREILYKLMNKLSADGKAVIFISHDIDEILDKCTVLTVLRDGNIIGEVSSNEMNLENAPRKIRNMMVGREIGEAYYREDYDISHHEEIALELKNINCGSIIDFSLKLHKGEIIGIGGLSGCGMHEIGRIAFGLDKPKSGEVLRNGIKIINPNIAVKNGMGYISKNRDKDALILNGSIEENIVLPSLVNLSCKSFINPIKERKLSEKGIDLLSIKCGNRTQWVSTLSGGNKQKVSFAKWLAKESEVFIMDCPTRGVDIGVKQAMYRLISEMKKEGKAILMISEELPELIGMVDRLIIMKDFKVSHEFERSQNLKETDVIEYMI
ncbi:sugar ABC transporter ATP-binding protein [Clostridium sp. SYSU_GA19001]|uniref:sugar ABC transporter ATP-binding protein n=1 Tax=Clostridium caldaquaticum TaxID=2940653 RepID=UPI0020773C60|nr:sugar ABC transporter ATP-binding protein [Clostridium caldaquaticum]MCM8709957.1 sugar ABC transporter ATP-binding protein [Clostridium caldaquaticum]